MGGPGRESGVNKWSEARAWKLEGVTLSEEANTRRKEMTDRCKRRGSRGAGSWTANTESSAVAPAFPNRDLEH